METKSFRKTLAERLGRNTGDIDALTGALGMLLVENASALRALAIPGFGTFVPVKHDEQIVNDLASGHRILFPPEIVLEFYPGAAMRRKTAPQTQPLEPAETPAGGIMTLPMAADALASINSIGHDAAETFLKGFFSLIEEEDARNGCASIKGIGEFQGVRFLADKALAKDINQPFAMFEPVELDDDLNESDLEPGNEPVAVHEKPVENDTPAKAATESTISPAEETPCTPPSYSSQDNDSTTSYQPEQESAPAMPIPVQESHRRTLRATLSVCAIIVCLLGSFVSGFILGRQSTPQNVREIVRVDTVINTVHDTIRITPENPPQPKADPVYDTVTPTRYLATMSRQYYGRMEYWVYIYKANEQSLGNPDKIKPGTRVEIPPFERYAQSANDSVNLAEARRMSEQIYSRFRK